MLIRGLSGNLGDQFTVKSSRNGRTVVSVIKDFENDREYSPAQLAQQQAFRKTIAYAKAKKGEEIYVTKANGGRKSPYNIAIQDWLHRPEILEVDLSAWINGKGNKIRVRAQDDVKVVSVKVTITDETGAVLEEGEAQDLDTLWWEYSPSETPGVDKQVTISAMDLPGHVTEWNESLDHPEMV